MRALALLSLLVLSLAGLWASTEYVAAELHYPPAIGVPWVVFGSWPVYPPWGWLLWRSIAESRAPTLFRDASAITTIGAIAGCAAAAIAAVHRGRSGPSRSHGSARWATTTEMRRAGLLREAGVVLGQTGDAVFRHGIDAAGRTLNDLRMAQALGQRQLRVPARSPDETRFIRDVGAPAREAVMRFPAPARELAVQKLNQSLGRKIVRGFIPGL